MQGQAELFHGVRCRATKDAARHGVQVSESEQAQAIAETLHRETIEALRLCQKRTDGNGHWLADQSLLILLEMYGFADIVAEFEKVPKNYKTPQQVVDYQTQKIAHLEHKKQRVFEVCRANIRWQRKQREMQAQQITELKNGKAIGSLHHQIAALEVKNAELEKQLDAAILLDRAAVQHGESLETEAML